MIPKIYQLHHALKLPKIISWLIVRENSYIAFFFVVLGTVAERDHPIVNFEPFQACMISSEIAFFQTQSLMKVSRDGVGKTKQTRVL